MLLSLASSAAAAFAAAPGPAPHATVGGGGLFRPPPPAAPPAGLVGLIRPLADARALVAAADWPRGDIGCRLVLLGVTAPPAAVANEGFPPAFRNAARTSRYVFERVWYDSQWSEKTPPRPSLGTTGHDVHPAAWMATDATNAFSAGSSELCSRRARCVHLPLYAAST